MENKSNNIRESSTIVGTVDYSQIELKALTQKVTDYQHKMRYVYERGIIKRNLAYTLNLSDKI